MDKLVLPKHVGFIMDGNGRWATQRGKSRSAGHVEGYKALEKVIDYGFRRGVEILSFYAFSTENWSRPKEEVEKLLSLMTNAIKVAGKKLIKNKIKLVISGDYSMVKPSVKRAIDQLIEKTSTFSPYVVNICFNYGGRAEICSAVNKIIASGAKEVNEQLISSYLYTKDLADPDLIIRTSGEQRLSNFLLWQSSYSELYFTNVLWPDFNDDEFEKALTWFGERNRRFGKV